MKKKVIIVIIILIVAIVGISLWNDYNNNFSNNDKDNELSNNNKKQILNDDYKMNNDVKNENNIELNDNLEDLINEKSIKLTISQEESKFIGATAKFTDKVIELLADHGESQWRDVEIDFYDVILRFDGYKDIHMNTFYGTMWFEGSNEIYKSKLVDRWDNYIIKIVKGKPTYDVFEETLLTKVVFGDCSEAVLINDGRLTLRVDDKEIVIEENIEEDAFILDEVSVLYNSCKLTPIENTNLLSVSINMSSMIDPFISQYIYKYENNKLSEVCNLNDIESTIDDIDFERKIVSIKFPYTDSVYKLKLTDKEYMYTKEKINELKENNVIIDDEFMKNIKGNLMCCPIKTRFMDIDNDGSDELLLTIMLDTVGAVTPISINEEAIIVFDIIDNNIEFSDVIFERDNNDIQ
ncbi:MAG: hypothetical protein N4A63_11520 [Vallitalea sp.]|jgi:hypothetical protein|nr:hypothetical protein [Vallitalea sp.]